MKKAAPPARPESDVVIYSFVVHVWREKIGPRRFVWRGSLTEVQSGATRYFQSLPALAKTVSQAVGKKTKKEKTS